jgi:hypothetical protein
MRRCVRLCSPKAEEEQNMKIKKLTLLVAVLAMVLSVGSYAVAQVTQEPVAQEEHVAQEEPIAEESVAQQPVIQQPAAQEPVAQQPVAQ